jgi:heptaprenyl diphosphate synthase
MRDILLPITPEDRRIAALAALAIGLSLAEAALPSPLPGVKPGLANIVVLLVMLQHGFRTAVWVAVIRLLAGSLLLGIFLAPGFWLASAGTAASLLAMAVAGRLPSRWFGPVSISVLMAFAHIAGQLLLAKYWLFAEANLIVLLPVFALSALAFGAANGLIVARLASRQFIAETDVKSAQSAHA